MSKNSKSSPLAAQKKAAIRPATKQNLITYAMVTVAFVLFQTLSATGNLKFAHKSLLVPVCTSIIMAVSLNLVVGVLGELSLGHAGFMCVGAYAGSFFSVITQDFITTSWIRFTLAFVVAAVCASVAGILIGIPVLRLKGDYLAIVTLAFGEIIKTVVNALYVGVDSEGAHVALDSANLSLAADGKIIMKGPQGITGTPKDSTFVIGFVLIMITLFIVTNLMDSRTGRAIMSIRDNRIAAESVGIDITKYKLMVFTISAAIAGCAGVLYSHNISTLTATTSNFGYNMSILVLVYVVLGGLGNIRGSIIAATILYALPELLRGFSEYRMLIYAVILIVMMIVNNGSYFIKLKEQFSVKFSSMKKNKEVI